MNFRERFIREHLDKCQKQPGQLNAWEKDFIAHVATIEPARFTNAQYNRLKEIADELPERKRSNGRGSGPEVPEAEGNTNADGADA